MTGTRMSNDEVAGYWSTLSEAFQGREPGLLYLAPPFLSKSSTGYRAISEKKLQKARAIYAAYNDAEETTILFQDSTLFGSAKYGYIITDRCAYSRYKDRAHRFALSDVRSVELKDMHLFLNGQDFAFLGSSLDSNIVEDFIARLVGLERPDILDFVSEVRASEHVNVSALKAEMTSPERLDFVFHRKSDVLREYSKVRNYETLILTESYIVPAIHYAGILAQGRNFKVLPKSEFTRIRVVGRREHPEGHSHTPHAVGHVVKHATTGNVLIAAASVIADINHHNNPPLGRLVLDVFAEREGAAEKEERDYNDQHLIFYGLDPSKESYVIRFLKNSGLAVVESGETPH